METLYSHLGNLVSRAKQFEDKYRITEDLYLASGIGPRLIQHVYQTVYSHKHNLFYEVESFAKHPNYANKEAIVYARSIPGKNIKADGDDMFNIERFTYSQLLELVLKMSHVLDAEYGIKQGDIVCFFIPNKPIFIILWLALWNLGATPCFLNYNLSHNPLVHSIKIVNTKIIFADKIDPSIKNLHDSLKEINEAVPDLQIVDFDEFELLDYIKDKPEFRQLDSIRDNVKYYDAGVLVNTSGTTGLPKSAVNSWRKCYFASRFFPHAMRITDKTRLYTAMPLYHGTASILGVLPALINGGTLCLGYKFSLSSYWTQVKLTDANSIQYVGEVCRYLVDGPITKDEDTIKGQIILAVGNGLRPDIWQKFKDRFGIRAIGEFYASSESPFATTCYETNGIGIGCIRNYGWLASKVVKLSYNVIKMQDEDDNAVYRNSDGFCEEPKPGEKGEMMMRILNPKNIKATFPGYINNDEATYSKIIRDVFNKGDCWVRSDDLMKFDDYGCLHFVDRLGDTYRWKSENVSTTEVENEILEVDEIEHCVVVGAKVENHEGRCGYAIMQTFNKNNENVEERQAMLQKIADRVYGHLPHFARPCFVRFESIKLNENHKLSKKIFRDPVLPFGKSNKLTVFYLDNKTKSYQLMDESSYGAIIGGKIRI